MVSGFFFGMVAAFSFGTADFLAGWISRKIGTYSTLFYMQAVGFVVLSLYFFIIGDWEVLIGNTQAIWLSLIFMGLDLFGILCLYQGLAKGNVSLVAPIGSSFAIITVILAVFFGESPSLIMIVAIFLTIGGVIVSSTPISDISRTHSRKGIGWAILASILLGIAFFGTKFPTAEIGAEATVWLGRLQAVVFLMLFFLLSKRKLEKPHRRFRDWGFLILIGVLDMIAFISYNIGIMQAYTTLVVTITSLFAVFTLLWGMVILRERLLWNQVLGVGMIFLGLILIQF